MRNSKTLRLNAALVAEVEKLAERYQEKAMETSLFPVKVTARWIAEKALGKGLSLLVKELEGGGSEEATPEPPRPSPSSGTTPPRPSSELRERLKALSLEGLTALTIAQALNSEGFLNSRGNPWNKNSVVKKLKRIEAQ